MNTTSDPDVLRGLLTERLEDLTRLVDGAQREKVAVREALTRLRTGEPAEIVLARLRRVPRIEGELIEVGT